jgi:outer membrane protein OmpA-like peptidoglycan-associated protein
LNINFYLFYRNFALAILRTKKAKHWQNQAIIRFMKNSYIFIYLLFALLIFNGCTSKTVTYLDNVQLVGTSKQTVKNATLQEIADIFHADTNATVLHIGDTPPQNDNNLTLFVTKRYLKIMFNHPQLFDSTETLLSPVLQDNLDQIIPILQKYPALIIQIIGHAYNEGTPKEMRHYADMRAISVAEYLYAKGLKQDILAKGCGSDVPKKVCSQKGLHKLCDMRNRRVEIFLYTSKDDVITRCK